MADLKDLFLVWSTLISTVLLVLRILENRPRVTIGGRSESGKRTYTVSVRNVSRYPVELVNINILFPRNAIKLSPAGSTMQDIVERAARNGGLNIYLAEGQTAEVKLVFSRDEFPRLVVMAVRLNRHRGMLTPYLPSLIVRTRSQLGRLRTHEAAENP